MNKQWVYKILNYSALGLGMAIVLYAFYFGVWTVLYTETGNGDNVEHLHATWLVAQGKIPYRDFFQHHNPLLWYLFAPFIKHSTDVIFLLNAVHSVGLLAGVLTFWVVYKICTRFFASSLSSLISLIILCPPYYYIYCFNYNPDTFMALAFAVGLYCLFSYWDKKQLISLCLAFQMFFIAFLFTQKILIILGILGLISLYVFYLKKTPYSDILYAITIPLLCLLLFVALLYYADALRIYWLSNYPFNIVMQKYYGNNQVNVVQYQLLTVSVSLALLSILGLFSTASIYYRIVAILFLIELPLRCFYFSLAPYYLLPLMIFVCCLNSAILDVVKEKAFILLFIFLGIGIYFLHDAKTQYIRVRGTDRSFAKYLALNVTPCDYVISGYFGNQSAISKDPYYYWSMLGHIDMAGEEMQIAPHPNINELVLKYKPKLVYGGIYWSSYHQNRGDTHTYIQQLSPEIINQYYLPTPFQSFYILKYEYRQRNCQYDEKRKEWLYVN